jgi:hypothetical protein
LEDERLALNVAPRLWRGVRFSPSDLKTQNSGRNVGRYILSPSPCPAMHFASLNLPRGERREVFYYELRTTNY